MYAQGRNRGSEEQQSGGGGSTVIWQTEVAASGSSSAEPLHMQDQHKKASCSRALRMCLHVCVCKYVCLCVCVIKWKHSRAAWKTLTTFSIVCKMQMQMRSRRWLVWTPARTEAKLMLRERERCVVRPTVCHFACTLCIQYFLCAPSFRVSLSLSHLFSFSIPLSTDA